jgi:hypothetical protein
MFLQNVGQYPTTPAGIVGIWTSFLLTLAIFSYPLFKENRLYRFAEHTTIAFALAVISLGNIDGLIRGPVLPSIMEGKILLVVPVILGLAMYSQLHPKYSWVSRYPIAILVGSSIGLGMAGLVIPRVTSQVISTITSPATGGVMDWFNFSFIAIGTICSVLYFLLTYGHKGMLTHPTRLGRFFIMFGLGSLFGNTVLFRMSMLSSRVKFLLQVLKIIPM